MSDRERVILEDAEMIERIKKEEIQRGLTPSYAKLYARGMVKAQKNGFQYPFCEFFADEFTWNFIKGYFRGYLERIDYDFIKDYLKRDPIRMFIFAPEYSKVFLYKQIFDILDNIDIDDEHFGFTKKDKYIFPTECSRKNQIFLKAVDDKSYVQWLIDEFNILIPSVID